jgi:hypothetical protein
MFDYQAGEKFKLTLIMVGVAGMMAGIFFTLLLLPTPEPQQYRRAAGGRPHGGYSDDVNGKNPLRAVQAVAAGNAPIPQPQAPPPANAADPNTSLTLIQEWLGYAWDLSAGTAKDSQAKAMMYMTADCANAYRQNVFTPQIAQQIEQSGVKSSFRMDRIYTGGNNPDGSVVVFVEGEQVLSVPGKGSKTRAVRLEYMVKKTQEGLRISGISEGRS